MKTKTDIEITNWPLLPAKETNRQRIVRALREADGVVEQCYGVRQDGDKRCALEVLDDVFGKGGSYFMGHGSGIPHLNDYLHLTFAQIADVLESEDGYWYSRADEEFRG